MRQGVSVVLIRSKDGAILMQHRDNNPNIANPDYWGVPGGAAHENEEDLRKTAARELEEETGYVIKDKDLFFVCNETQVIGKTEIFRSIYCGLYDDKQGIKCLEGQEMRFICSSEFEKMRIVETHRDFIKHAEGILFGGHVEKRG